MIIVSSPSAPGNAAASQASELSAPAGEAAASGCTTSASHGQVTFKHRSRGKRLRAAGDTSDLKVKVTTEPGDLPPVALNSSGADVQMIPLIAAAAAIWRSRKTAINVRDVYGPAAGGGERAA
ncbi:hypothetical protein EYF80_038791 [Liparis tanakae]|uniref:Uncharacterized protein n=1 Tax=Liparis tanakae TaxID=230148 RepID=A0A4Z2GC89_9TELE|nr:hypothetical protein EYF80_038791 [Liparis tanakae]